MIKEFFQNLAAIAPPHNATDAQLNHVGRLMAELATTIQLDATTFPPAIHGQELVYPLHIGVTGPSLYLVSDAPGIQSQPHEHRTWAVIAGISGNEINELFEISDELKRTVKRVSTTEVQRLGVLCLRNNAIHSTLAAGVHPTYHLHLYGKPLSELHAYALRCFDQE